jgi:hypothetical protein
VKRRKAWRCYVVDLVKGNLIFFAYAIESMEKRREFEKKYSMFVVV